MLNERIGINENPSATGKESRKWWKMVFQMTLLHLWVNGGRDVAVRWIKYIEINNESLSMESKNDENEIPKLYE